MGFIDSHVHLQFSDFDADREAVIRRAQEAGIEEFVLVGSDLENSRQALRLAETHDHLWAAVGVHPHEAKDVDARALTMIEEYAKHPRAVAIGEVGLDFFHHHSPRETQMKVLPAFLQLQQRVCKPIILHCRDAYDELILLLREAQKTPYNGVLHCFSSSREVMEKFLDLGFCIAFSGALTYKKNDTLREACKACPLDRLLLETDAPYLSPQSKRGTRNEPSYLIETARTAAEIHQCSLEKLGELTSANTRRVFRL